MNKSKSKPNSKPKPKKRYDLAISGLLEVLDAIEVDPQQKLFKKWSDKEHFESLVMFTVRKREAAMHHSENVARLRAASKRSAIKEAEAALAKHHSPPKEVSFSMSSRSSATAYVHELSAFLAALRSGLDFLTKAAVELMPGVTSDSMGTLLKLLAKGQTGLILSVVAKHEPWLALLRDYRDEVVHRLVMEAPSSGWRVSKKGVVAIAEMPIVVPKATPKFAFDTRRAQMMMEDEVGLMRMDSHATATYDNGKEEMLDHKIAFLPAPGYVDIGEFMQAHLDAYDAFVADMLEALTTLKLQPVK